VPISSAVSPFDLQPPPRKAAPARSEASGQRFEPVLEREPERVEPQRAARTRPEGESRETDRPGEAAPEAGRSAGRTQTTNAAEVAKAPADPDVEQVAEPLPDAGHAEARIPVEAALIGLA
jgi:hypothetical protein